MPAITSTFKSGEPSLPDILRDIKDGKVQFPDFQRGWVRSWYCKLVAVVYSFS